MNFLSNWRSNTDNRGRHQRIGLQAPPHDSPEVAINVDTDTLPDPEAQPRSNAVTLVARATARSEDGPETTASSSRVNTTTTSASSSGQAVSHTPSTTDTGQNERNAETSADSDEDVGTPSTDARETVSETHQRLLELSSEQEVRRRGQSTCRIILYFLLIRLWIEALLYNEPALLLFCILLTSATVRWVRQTQMEDGELNRRMDELFRRAASEDETINAEAGSGSGNGRSSISSREMDLRLMSFQAQLAMAIMESQRHILETGGFGRPDDGEDENENRGVGEEARREWESFEFVPVPDTIKSGYATTSLDKEGGLDKDAASMMVVKNINDELPSCSICLCEYERGEALTKLPCGHTYHTECLNAWCSNHTRCPLCNLDLEQGEADSLDVQVN